MVIGPESDKTPRATAARVFATTHWSVVLLAAGNGSADAERALARLCETYWYPLYVYIRRRGHACEDAQDLTQGFFARLLDKNSLDHADPERGRFRSFLLSSVENFLNNEWDRSMAQKRGGGCKTISWDEQDAEGRYLNEPVENMTPQRIFEKRWAGTLLELVLKKMRTEFLVSGRPELFEALKTHLWSDEVAISYAELAVRLNMTIVAIKVTVHRLRHRYRELLREEISHTVASAEEVNDEIRHLISIMSE
jgi:RNA polymerase sigma factor (sigma-70 family)